MTARLYEIHRIRVEDAQHAASVMGHVRGMMVDGTGYISGRTDTVHMANLFANGAAYSLTEVTIKLPIRIGDDLLVMCHQGKNGGVWQVLSVANRSTKTSYAHSLYDSLWHYWLGFCGALLSVTLIIGFSLAPMALYSALKFTQCDFAEMITANEALGRLANLPDAQVDAAVQAFNQAAPKRLLELMFGWAGSRAAPARFPHPSGSPRRHEAGAAARRSAGDGPSAASGPHHIGPSRDDDAFPHPCRGITAASADGAIEKPPRRSRAPGTRVARDSDPATSHR